MRMSGEERVLLGRPANRPLPRWEVRESYQGVDMEVGRLRNIPKAGLTTEGGSGTVGE